MKILIASKGWYLSDALGGDFGRCSWFIVYDTDTHDYDSIENPNADATGGAGIQTARLAVSEKVKAILSCNFGPNAFKTIKAEGIKMYKTERKTVAEAINSFKEGKLREVIKAGKSKKRV
jgi:predicted Fe-Mo cluster-binding NifX family protein